MRNPSDVLFSLVIPTRSRMRLLTNCLHSFFGKAKDHTKIEAILMADYDDFVMRNFEEYVLNTDYNIKVMFQRQSTKMIKDYNNYGTQCTTGKYVWIMNDDYEAVTQNWDSIVYNKCEEFLADKPDRIVYVQMDDSTHTNWGRADELGCCCPIISKETVDIQNGVMPGEIDMWGADSWLYWIFKRLPKNRILNIIPDVKVLHHCRHNGSVQPDDIAQRVAAVSVKSKLTGAEMNHYVELFSRHLA